MNTNVKSGVLKQENKKITNFQENSNGNVIMLDFPFFYEIYGVLWRPDSGTALFALCFQGI